MIVRVELRVIQCVVIDRCFGIQYSVVLPLRLSTKYQAIEIISGNIFSTPRLSDLNKLQPQKLILLHTSRVNKRAHQLRIPFHSPRVP